MKRFFITIISVMICAVMLFSCANMAVEPGQAFVPADEIGDLNRSGDAKGTEAKTENVTTEPTAGATEEEPPVTVEPVITTEQVEITEPAVTTEPVVTTAPDTGTEDPETFNGYFLNYATWKNKLARGQLYYPFKENENNKITLESAQKIKVGMTLAEVMDILGSKGVEDNTNLVFRHFEIQDEGFLYIYSNTNLTVDDDAYYDFYYYKIATNEFGEIYARERTEAEYEDMINALQSVKVTKVKITDSKTDLFPDENVMNPLAAMIIPAPPTYKLLPDGLVEKYRKMYPKLSESDANFLKDIYYFLDNKTSLREFAKRAGGWDHKYDSCYQDAGMAVFEWNLGEPETVINVKITFVTAAGFQITDYIKTAIKEKGTWDYLIPLLYEFFEGASRACKIEVNGEIVFDRELTPDERSYRDFEEYGLDFTPYIEKAFDRS